MTDGTKQLARRVRLAVVTVMAVLALASSASAQAEETMTCEVHAGTIRVSTWDGRPAQFLFGDSGLETITAPGTCVVPGPDPANPGIYDAQITDSGQFRSQGGCGLTLYSEASWWTGGGVSIELFDSTGARSPKSATGEWAISWGITGYTPMTGSVTDGEGETGTVHGMFEARAPDQVDCFANRTWRQFTFDGGFVIEYETS